MMRLAAVFLALFGWQAAIAHTRSESHTSWTIDTNAVDVIFTVSDLETARLSRDYRPPGDEEIEGYLHDHLGVASGRDSCRESGGQVLASAHGYRRFEFHFECPSSNDITLSDHAFFDLVPTHVNFAQIQVGQSFSERVMQSDSQELKIEDRALELRSASFLMFVQMGIMHIFTGIDHMSFLVGLVLISRRLRDLVFVVTGFTIGHSLTLALAVTGIIRPHAEFIDALVALTIALIGAENIVVASHRPRTVAFWTGALLLGMAALRMAGIGLLPPLLLVGAAFFAADYLMISGYLRDAGRLRLLVTLVFGLIHGFGFAADLLESRLPSEKLVQILLGFNIGVEIGQLTVVLLLVGVVALLALRHLTLPRRLVVDVTASALVAVGTYWFLGRSF